MRSGRRAQKIIDGVINDKKELHDSEEGNYGMVYLYHDGKFWNAYERSAYILCTQVCPLKPTKRAIKSAGGIHLVSVGFPVGRATEWK